MRNVLRHLRLADLELFVTTARLKNLSKAATLHSLSQSAASAVIQRVESAFGRPLCYHEKRQFRLTPEGRLLLPRVEAWLADFQEKVIPTTDVPLRLATTYAIARVVLPQVLAHDSYDLFLLRPDQAYEAVLKDQADVALVLDNAPWKGMQTLEMGQGAFGLYARDAQAPLGPVVLPENQIEVMALKQKWVQTYGEDLPIKAQIPSWSLIADLCTDGSEVGFLPNFLARQRGLYPVAWQPSLSPFRVLALYRSQDAHLHDRLRTLQTLCAPLFEHGG